MAGRRLRFRRLFRQEAITEPLPVISRLASTPYRNPRRGAAADAELRLALELVGDIGEALLRAGAGTSEISSSMLASGVALGLDEDYLWIDIIYGAIVISYTLPGEWPVTLLRTAARPGHDYARLTSVHDLVLQLVSGDLDRTSTRAGLEDIESAPRPWNRWVVTVALGVLAGLVIIILGGGPVVAMIGFLNGCLVDRIGVWAGRRQWPGFFVTGLGAAIAAASTVALAEASSRWPIGVNDPRTSSLVVAGGIMVLLAGLSLVASGQDAIQGFPVTAVGRLVDVLMTTTAIIAGVGVVLSIASQLGLAGTIFTNPLEGWIQGLIWWSPPLAGAVAVCSALSGRAPGRLLLVTGLAGALGFALYSVVLALGLPGPIGTAAGAVLIGSLGRVWALRRRASPLAVVMPATTMLLPGLSIFQGLMFLTSGDTTAGLVTLFGALATGLAIAAGCVLGDLLATPLEAGMDSIDNVRHQLAADM